MKHTGDKIRIRKIFNNWEIVIERHYIDDFGKHFSFNKIWDNFVSKELAEIQINSHETKQQMINCGYTIID